MKLTDQFETFAALLKKKITLNNYRWFFIPTVQYASYEVEVIKDDISQGQFRERAVKGHYLCFTIEFYYKRTKI